MTRKTLGTYGPRGRSVRVFVEGDLVRVQWREAGLLKTKSWANTAGNRADAKAWARGFADAREAAPALTAQRLTLRGLWDAYQLAEFAHLRDNTRRLYTDGWRKWEQAWGPDFPADDVTPQMLDQFRAALEGAGLAVNTVRMAIRAVKMVHAFGDQRNLIRNRLAPWRFKLAKEKRPVPPPEFRAGDFQRILAALDPAKPGQWRAYVALALCGYQGARQHAVLHLRWDDVDVAGGVITWRAAWDKVGREWSQPLRAGTRAALAVAARWTTGSRWVIPAPRADEPYSKQSLWWMLDQTCRRLGIVRARGQGAHSLRRMLAGDLNALTGNVALALQSIGDTSLQMASRYVQPRDDRIVEAFLTLDRNAAVIANENAPGDPEADSANRATDNDLREEPTDAP